MKNFLLSSQLGWGINIIAWAVFILTGNHFLEIILGLLCGYSIFIGYKLSEKKLMSSSIFNMIWMFLWGFGIMGDSFDFSNFL